MGGEGRGWCGGCKRITDTTWFWPQTQSLLVEMVPSFSRGSAIQAVQCAPQDTDFTNSVCNCFTFLGCLLRSSVPSPNWPKSLAPRQWNTFIKILGHLCCIISKQHDDICSKRTRCYLSDNNITTKNKTKTPFLQK